LQPKGRGCLLGRGGFPITRLSREFMDYYYWNQKGGGLDWKGRNIKACHNKEMKVLCPPTKGGKKERVFYLRGGRFHYTLPFTKNISSNLREEGK